MARVKIGFLLSRGGDTVLQMNIYEHYWTHWRLLDNTHL